MFSATSNTIAHEDGKEVYRRNLQLCPPEDVNYGFFADCLLNACQGNCDEEECEDTGTSCCADGLSCFERNALDGSDPAPPGCTTATGTYNYCYVVGNAGGLCVDDEDSNVLRNAISNPTGCLLGLCQGNCNNNDENCVGNLICDKLSFKGGIAQLPSGCIKGDEIIDTYSYCVDPNTAPTRNPTESPTSTPSEKPSESPTSTPSEKPSPSPTGNPSSAPSGKPTGTPSTLPTKLPSTQPSDMPTIIPSTEPSNIPSVHPTTSLSPTLSGCCSTNGVTCDLEISPNCHLEKNVCEAQGTEDVDCNGGIWIEINPPECCSTDAVICDLDMKKECHLDKDDCEADVSSGDCNGEWIKRYFLPESPSGCCSKNDIYCTDPDDIPYALCKQDKLYCNTTCPDYTWLDQPESPCCSEVPMYCTNQDDIPDACKSEAACTSDSCGLYWVEKHKYASPTKTPTTTPTALPTVLQGCCSADGRTCKDFKGGKTQCNTDKDYCNLECGVWIAPTRLGVLEEPDDEESSGSCFYLASCLCLVNVFVVFFHLPFFN